MRAVYTPDESLKIVANYIQGRLDKGDSLEVAAESAKDRYRLSSAGAAKQAYEVVNR